MSPPCATSMLLPSHRHPRPFHHHLRSLHNVPATSFVSPRRPFPKSKSTSSQPHPRRHSHSNSRQSMYIVSSATESPSSSSSSSTTTLDNNTNNNNNNADFITQLSQFGAGALAGLVNTLVLSPLDVIKTRLQAQGAGSGLAVGLAGSSTAATTARTLRYAGTLDAFRSMLREEGFGSYYRGLSASLWAFVPNWAIYWYSYETFKRVYTPKGERPSHVVHILSALSAGGITAVTTAPFWTLKSRLQVDMSAVASQRRYKSVSHGFRTIVKEEGVRGLYKGLIPTFLGLGHVAIQFPLYEYLKTRFSTPRIHQQHAEGEGKQEKQGDGNGDGNGNGKFNAAHVLMASSISKAVASAVFYPHEVVRTRIQVDDRVLTNSSELARAVNLFKDIVKRDGFKGLYRGFGANLVRTVPACMLTFTSYELAKRFAEAQTLKHQAAVAAAEAAAAEVEAEASVKNVTSTTTSENERGSEQKDIR